MILGIGLFAAVGLLGLLAWLGWECRQAGRWALLLEWWSERRGGTVVCPRCHAIHGDSLAYVRHLPECRKR